MASVTNVEAVLTMKSGLRQVFTSSSATSTPHGPPVQDLCRLRESVQDVQLRINAALTDLINKETVSAGGDEATASNTDEDDDVEDIVDEAEEPTDKKRCLHSNGPST